MNQRQIFIAFANHKTMNHLCSFSLYILKLHSSDLTLPLWTHVLVLHSPCPSQPLKSLLRLLPSLLSSFMHLILVPHALLFAIPNWLAQCEAHRMHFINHCWIQMNDKTRTSHGCVRMMSESEGYFSLTSHSSMHSGPLWMMESWCLN